MTSCSAARARTRRGGSLSTITRGIVFLPIPRVIHQTWKTERIPPQWYRYRQSWIDAHPAWEYRLWTDEDNRRLIAERYPSFLPAYDAFPRHIQRVDAAKYFILYTYGGVYADLDCECVRPIDPLVARGGAIVSRTRDGVIDGAILASPPGHRFWQTVFCEMEHPTRVARLLRYLPGCRASHVLFTTGPRMLKRAVRRHAAAPARGDAAGLTIFDPVFFSSRSWLDRFRPFTADEAFVRHHYSDSWLGPLERRVHVWLTRRTAFLLLLALAVAALGVVLAR